MAGPDVDVVITEIGGTVGDIESLPFLEAARQVRHDVGRDNCFFLHVSLVPYIGPSGELKTKPTQHSVAALRSIGIQPDAIVCRSDREIPETMKRKISLMCDVDDEAVVNAADAPVDLRHPQGAALRGPRRLRRTPAQPAVPRRRLDRVGRPAAPGAPPGRGGHGRAGRQVHRPARRLPLGRRGAARRRVRPRGQGQAALGPLRRVPDAGGRGAPPRRASTRSACPAGFGIRGIEGKVGALRVRPRARHPDARPLPGPAVHGDRVRPPRRRPRPSADSTEFDPGCAEPVIATMAEQVDIVAGERRHGRHHAPRALPGRAQGRARSCARPTARPRSRSATGTATRSTTPTATGSRRPGWSSPAPRRTATWSSSSSCPRDVHPYYVAHPGAPRAALAADPAAPAVRRPGRRGDRAAARAAVPDRRGGALRRPADGDATLAASRREPDVQPTSRSPGRSTTSEDIWSGASAVLAFVAT